MVEPAPWTLEALRALAAAGPDAPGTEEYRRLASASAKHLLKLSVVARASSIQGWISRLLMTFPQATPNPDWLDGIVSELLERGFPEWCYSTETMDATIRGRAFLPSLGEILVVLEAAYAEVRGMGKAVSLFGDTRWPADWTAAEREWAVTLSGFKAMTGPLYHRALAWCGETHPRVRDHFAAAGL
jgi:hypothetical protein